MKEEVKRRDDNANGPGESDDDRQFDRHKYGDTEKDKGRHERTNEW